MIDARCSCGAVMLSLAGPTNRVAACHCIECQRRTGAPLGVGAFYPADSVTISGMTSLASSIFNRAVRARLQTERRAPSAGAG
jgi:hypothetical protein